MPFRCLEYVTRIYEGIFPQKKRYAENVFKIPNPDFYVVYVGKKDLPQEQELRLSDAFYKKDSSSLELIVKVRNCTNSQGAHLKRQSTQRFPKASCLPTWIENRGR